MNITKQVSLAAAVVSMMYLTACQSLTDTQANQNTSPVIKNNTHQYPATRTQEQKQDKFRSGEFGRPAHLVGGGVSSRIATLDNPSFKPDTGINRYFGEKQYDKYRWLENVDVIGYEFESESSKDRQRNPIGTRLENDRPNNQLDNRTALSLQQVKPQEKSEVTAWVDAQNQATKAYLNSIPLFEQISKNSASLYDFEHTIRKVKTDKVGELHLFRGADGYERVVRTDNEGNKHELWRETDLERGLRDATGDFYVSADGSYFAMYLSTGGADNDAVFLHIIDSLTGKEVRKPKRVGEQINQAVYEANWIDDKTVLYSTADARGVTDIRRYTVGSNRLNDPIEVANGHIDNAFIAAPSLEGKDNRYLVIPASKNGVENVFYIKDLKTGKLYRPHDTSLTDRYRNYAEFYIASKFVHLDEETGDLWFVSGKNDDQKGEIVKTNLHNLNKQEVVIPAHPYYQDIIDAYYHKEGDGYFLINYRKDGQHKLILSDMKGNHLRDLTPAQAGYADNLGGYVAGEQELDSKLGVESSGDDESYITFRYQNAGLPRTVYKYSIAKDAFIDIRRRDLYPFKESDYETKLVKYKSKDGTQVPMAITYKKGTVLNGKNPTMMLAYGGFSVMLDNLFNHRYATWLEAGGIYAQPHIRGGAEYGDQWHKDGSFQNKINVFDDFEAAGDYLAQQGYTSPEYLMISGGSNGGLLVGAAMTRAPHKYRVAIPAVGVLDMLRADAKYYLGQWNGEYGSSHDSKAMYDYLKSYSPYHNVKAGVCYPSTLVTTAKRDDRVLPFHSYKFAAALQEHQACNNPTFLYVDEVQGHGQRTPRQRKEYAALTTAFSLHQMGIDRVPDVVRPSVETLKGEKWLKEEADAKKK